MIYIVVCHMSVNKTLEYIADIVAVMIMVVHVIFLVNPHTCLAPITVVTSKCKFQSVI